MIAPVLCADGITFERGAIEPWLEDHDTSPLTGAPLPHKLLIANLTVRGLVQEHTASVGGRRVAISSPKRWNPHTETPRPGASQCSPSGSHESGDHCTRTWGCASLALMRPHCSTVSRWATQAAAATARRIALRMIEQSARNVRGVWVF